MKVALEFRSDKSSRFWEVEVKGPAMTVRYGRIGTDGQTKTKKHASSAKAKEEANKLIEAKKKKGYQEAGAKAEKKAGTSKKKTKSNGTRARSSTKNADLKALRYSKVLPELRVPRLDESDDETVLVSEGDLRVKGKLEIDYGTGRFRGKTERVVGLLVRGDLIVDGDLMNHEDDENSPFLQVEGNLRARGFASGSACIDIAGTLEANCVLGVYNHGSVKAKEIKTKLIATEHLVDESAGFTGYRFDSGGLVRYFERGVEDESRVCDISGVFHKSLLRGEVGDKYLDFRKAQKRLAKGQDIDVRPYKSIREQAKALVSRWLPKAQSRKELDLGFKGIPHLPDELARFENLESLNLEFNALDHLPKSIRHLKKLQTLNLKANRLKKLPEWIGELQQLRELKLNSNWGITHLPDSVGKLTELEELDLKQTSIQDLPATLKDCAKLKTVDISSTVFPDSTGQFMTRLPEVLTRLPQLEKLCISDSLITTLPKRKIASKKLRSVRAKDTPLVGTDPKHPMFKTVKGNALWPAEHVCSFWLKRPPYDNRAKRYRSEIFAARVPAIAAILDSAAVPVAKLAKPIEKKLDKIVTELDSQGDAAFVVRECFQEASQALKGVQVKPALLKWLKKTFGDLASYETPVCPNAVFHLARKKDIDKYRKLGVEYGDFFRDTYQTEVPLCSGFEVLEIANRKFPAKSEVLAWEFDNRKLKNLKQATMKQAFRQGTWLRSTDFGFAFSYDYWAKQAWRK